MFQGLLARIIRVARYYLWAGYIKPYLGHPELGELPDPKGDRTHPALRPISPDGLVWDCNIHPEEYLGLGTFSDDGHHQGERDQNETSSDHNQPSSEECGQGAPSTTGDGDGDEGLPFP